MKNRKSRVRPIEVGDVERTALAMCEVGWGGKERQISFFEKHPDCVGFVAEEKGKIIGASFGAANGSVGWLGLIFVSPGFRGRGAGASLTRAVTDYLEKLGCRSLVLVATEMGEVLYEKLGFEAETKYHGFSGPGHDSRVERFETASSKRFEAILRLDRRMMGEDRRSLLETMSRGWAFVGNDGEIRAHHFAAPWGGGPAVASDFEAGKAVVDFQRSVAGPEGSVRVWITEENLRGREYVSELGFEEFRVSPRMARGERIEWEPEGLWGVFSLAKG